MAGVRGTWALPVLRHRRQLERHLPVSRRSEPSMAPGVVATQPERPREARTDAALDQALATARTYRAPVSVGDVCRHDARQEPGAVCVGKAGISLSVKVRPGQSRADRPAASL